MNFDSKIVEIEQRYISLDNNLKEKHNKEMDDLYSFLEKKLPKSVKYSRGYLELKNQEINLVKLQNYKEASIITKKIQEIEKIDSDKWNKDKTEKIKSQTVKTAQKHLIEKNNLKKKIELELEVIKKEKDSALEIIMHKFKNRKFDLEMQQKQERNLNENTNLFKASKFSLY